MSYLFIILLFLLFIEGFMALSNSLFRQPLISSNSYHPLISILIPARNEAHNIGRLIESLQRQSYQNIEILIFDDESDDQTAAIVQRYAQFDYRIRLIHSDQCNEKGRGKNFACYQLSLEAKGRYFLMIDADVTLHSNLLPLVIQKMKQHHLALLSIFPYQICSTQGEVLTVPIMTNILLTLLPLPLVLYSPFSSQSAANGQFMFFDAYKYRYYNPHLHVMNHVVEDIAIARYLKHQGEPIACLYGEKRIRCRMYHNYREAVHGFSKNILHYFGGSALLTFAYICLNLTAPILIICTGKLWGIILWLFSLILTTSSISTLSHRNFFKTLMLYYPNLLVMIHITIKALIIKLKKQTIWKGRIISVTH